MAEQVSIDLTNADRLALFGRNDAHLALLERRHQVRVIARGDSLRVSGSDRAVRDAVAVVEHIIQQLQAGSLEARDIPALLRQRATPPVEEEEFAVETYRATVRARTTGQAQYLRAMRHTDVVFSIGPAGTGKTYLAVAVAVAALRSKDVSRIVLARPAVEAGESLGFLPGSLEDKVDPYLRPLYDALQELLEPERLRRLQEMKVVEIVPLAYMRGRTLNDAFIILDEAQNTTPQQMMMFLTRLGRRSRVVITGDITQTDLPRGQVSGLVEVQTILHSVAGLSFVHLTEHDVVRNPLVQEIVKAYELYHEQRSPAAAESVPP